MSATPQSVFQPRLTPNDLQRLKSALPTMPDKQKRRTLELLKTYQTEITKQQGRDSFLDFIQHVYPGYKVGPHHRKLAHIFEQIAEGKKKRVIVNIAPRHGKSEMISYLAPAWYLGKFPHKKVIMSSHTADLAVNFGRRVRNLVGSDSYKDIFPDVELQADSKSASRWGTNRNGEYFAIGVGGALAGRGADLFIIDDPHSEQEAKQLRPEVFEPAWEWFQSGPIQRLMPGGAIIVVMCMTGDTAVLLADGAEKSLKDIRPGDMVASYDESTRQIVNSRVLNHQSSGVDEVYTIKTRSGRILRANERHPFLVDRDGEREWLRLRDLKVGLFLVATRSVTVPHVHKLDRDCAPHVRRESRTTGRIPALNAVRLATRAVGSVRNALSAMLLRPLLACAEPAIASSTRRPSTPLPRYGRDELSTATASPQNSTTRWWQSVATAATSAVRSLLARTLAHIGMESSASTTATTQAGCVGFFATTATSQSATARPRKSSPPLPSTCGVELDEIVEILHTGREEVFDIEVERTGNFIANGVVSHNTRWSKLDLTGKIIDHYVKNHDIGADEWEVVEFPAIINDKPLWPEFWSLEELLSKKASMDVRYWMAQYEQNPVSEEGALIKREWWNVWEKEDPPPCQYIIMALDAAQETNTRADYNALTTWGVFFNDDTNNYNIILLNAIKQRLEFPELKELVLREYKEWEPDSFIVEKKSNGAALYQEMRRMGVPISEFTPGKGQDKLSRVNSVTDLFSSGIVWAPDRRWAHEVVEECNDFPAGKNDDLVDSTTLALARFRQGGFIKLPTDEKDPVQYFRSKRGQGYY